MVRKLRRDRREDIEGRSVRGHADITDHRPRMSADSTRSQNNRELCCDCSQSLLALRSYAENDAQRPLLDLKADSHVGVR